MQWSKPKHAIQPIKITREPKLDCPCGSRAKLVNDDEGDQASAFSRSASSSALASGSNGEEAGVAEDEEGTDTSAS
jgi:hypothetical protein